MTGLVLKLKPNEKMLVNGVVLQNGDRPARIRVRTSNASILRLRDAIHPDAANTPLKRIYYIAQLAMTDDADAAAAVEQVTAGIDAVWDVFPSEAAQHELKRALVAASEKKFFVVMRALKKLFPLEQQLLERTDV